MCHTTEKDCLASKLICLQGHALLPLRRERIKAPFNFQNRVMEIEVLHCSFRWGSLCVFLQLSWFYLMFTRSLSFYFGILTMSHLMLGIPQGTVHFYKSPFPECLPNTCLKFCLCSFKSHSFWSECYCPFFTNEKTVWVVGSPLPVWHCPTIVPLQGHLSLTPFPTVTLHLWSPVPQTSFLPCCMFSVGLV